MIAAVVTLSPSSALTLCRRRRRRRAAVAVQAGDLCIEVMRTKTEEGVKVERNHGPKLPAVFVRVSDAEAAAKDAAAAFWSGPQDF